MIGDSWNWSREWLGLGLDPKHLSTEQLVARALVVFVLALLMVRVSDRRVFAKKTAFELVLVLLMTSTLARAVNGSAPFFETLIAGFVLTGCHRLVATLAYYWPWFEKLVKGQADVLVEDGKTNAKNIRRHHFTQDDLLENLRLNGKIERIEEAKHATLERSGEVSTVKRQQG